MFHATFGYYAHGVVETTAVLPSGWRDRLVRFETLGTNGVTAWCLDPRIRDAILARIPPDEDLKVILDDVRSGG